MRVQMIALHAVLVPTLIDQLATEEETVTFRNKIIQNSNQKFDPIKVITIGLYRL